MPHLDYISTKDIRLIPDWRAAEPGCLLQVAELPGNGIITKPTIVFRTDRPLRGGEVSLCVLGLENGEKGKLYSASPTKALPALDVSDLAAICVVDSAPNYYVTDTTAGDLIAVADQKAPYGTACFIIAGWPQGGMAGYVCISSNISAYKIGSMVDQISFGEMVRIGIPTVRPQEIRILPPPT